MHANKKGDLAISTNAIVILIIAVIMLGLIIGFVTKGFGLVSSKFEDQFNTVEEPQPASAGEPISARGTADNLVSAKAGDQIRLKINVFNTATADAPSATPKISCLDDSATVKVLVANSEKVFPFTIPTKESHTYLYLATISKDQTPGDKLCQISVVLDSTTTVKRDFLIRIR